MQDVLYSTNDSIAYIVINRPSVRNALNVQTLVALQQAFEQAKADDAVRVVILSGAGDKAFAAGADIAEISGLTGNDAVEFSRRGQAVFSFIENLGKPVIAAVNGYALGGGCELSMACTLRVASENAVFGQPEVKLGLIPGYGGTVRLVRLVGFGRAAELMLTGDTLTAREALEAGLVNHIVPPADLILFSETLARKLMRNGPLALKFCFDAIQRGDFAAEAQLFGLCCDTEDMKEGTQAFLEKRPPHFKGR